MYALDPDVERMLQVPCPSASCVLLPLVQPLLQTLAHEFIENAVSVGCMFAKHRNSTTLETKDLQLHM